jgi:hypothetical protein
MTICIAAIVQPARAIVAVSDTQLSNETYSHEYGSMKIAPLINKWVVMYAGLPSTYRSLLRSMGNWLVRHNNPKDVSSIQRAIKHAYDAELDSLINRTVLSHLGMTRATFRRTGSRLLPEPLFRQLADEMKSAANDRRDDPDGTELLVLGFDDFGDPNLLYVGRDGTIVDRHSPGFDVIGSGSQLAYASLQSHDEFIRAPRIGEVCYRIHAAKFASESSAFVGSAQTITAVFHRDGRVAINYGAAESRSYFETERTRQIPTETLDAIEGSLSGGWAANF